MEFLPFYKAGIVAMADEAQIRSSLQIEVGKLEYQSKPTAFKADVSVAGGPTPGTILCTTDGTDVSLSELTIPGLCRIQNLDNANFVEVGIWDGVSYYPMMELLTGETFVFRLARDLGEEFGTGTGTTGAAINTLRIKADTASCEVLVEAFEK